MQNLSQGTEKDPMILVVYKDDATVHGVPLANERILKSLDQKRPVEKRWRFERMLKSQFDAKKIFLDPNYIAPATAQAKVAEMGAALSDAEKMIAELREQLAAKTGDTGTGAGAAAKTNEPDLSVPGNNLKSVANAGAAGKTNEPDPAGNKTQQTQTGAGNKNSKAEIDPATGLPKAAASGDDKIK